MLKKTILGSLQKIPEKTVNGRTTVIGSTPVVIFTVGTGKKIMIKGLTLRFDNEGANTYMECRYGTAGAASVHKALAANTPEATAGVYLVDSVLTAGQIVEFVGDNAANNGEADYNLTYQELPA